MKKLFMSLALSAMTALSVSAAPSFENFVTDPDQGVVTEISDITVIFPGCEKIEINVSDAIYLIGSDWEEVPGSLMNADNVLMFCPNRPSLMPASIYCASAKARSRAPMPKTIPPTTAPTSLSPIP